MTPDQRLERIESLLECLLEVAKIQARIAARSPGEPPVILTRGIEDIRPIEHPRPSPEPHPDLNANPNVKPETFSCPKCGGTAIESKGCTAIMPDRGIQHHCQRCEHYWRVNIKGAYLTDSTAKPPVGHRDGSTAGTDPIGGDRYYDSIGKQVDGP